MINAVVYDKKTKAVKRYIQIPEGRGVDSDLTKQHDTETEGVLKAGDYRLVVEEVAKEEQV